MVFLVQEPDARWNSSSKQETAERPTQGETSSTLTHVRAGVKLRARYSNPFRQVLLRISTFDSVHDALLFQSAGAARVFAQRRTASTSSARVTLSGCVERISARRMSVVSCCFCANAV